MAGADQDQEPLTGTLRGAGLCLLVVAIGLLGLTGGTDLTFILYRDQDAPALVFGMGLLLALGLWPRVLLRRTIGRAPPSWLPILFVFALAAAGTYLVFGNYALSRDELLAEFDADFLRAGLLISPLPVEWRPFAAAMQPIFMLPVSPEVGWISGYLPGNAALRALFDLTVGREWTNPALAALAAFALWRIARRLWPGRPGTALVPLVLLAASPQLLTMAMTPYAMTAHLAFNLLWLWCFLRGDRRGGIGALAAGFIATGLHQIVFHPIFAAPFILELLIARQWRRAAVYIAGYALIGLFWIIYWQLVLSAAGSVASAGEAAQQGLPFLLDKLADLIASFDVTAPVLMVLNLMRFISWTHLLLLPLVILAWPFIRRGEGIARPLALGIVLMLATLLILLPWQGHGWGYRYLHGFLGSFALLATFGWTRIAAAGQARRNAALALTTAATLLVILPFHLWSASAFVRPYRAAHAFLARADAEVVIVDPAGTFYTQDLVRNAPDVSNRPVTIDLLHLDETPLRALCARYRVALFDKRHAAAFGIRFAETPELAAKRRLLDALRCAPPLPLP